LVLGKLLALAYVLVSLATPPPPEDIVQTFWGRARSQELAARVAADD